MRKLFVLLPLFLTGCPPCRPPEQYKFPACSTKILNKPREAGLIFKDGSMKIVDVKFTQSGWLAGPTEVYGNYVFLKEGGKCEGKSDVVSWVKISGWPEVEKSKEY